MIQCSTMTHSGNASASSSAASTTTCGSLTGAPLSPVKSWLLIAPALIAEDKRLMYRLPFRTRSSSCRCDGCSTPGVSAGGRRFSPPSAARAGRADGSLLHRGLLRDGRARVAELRLPAPGIQRHVPPLPVDRSTGAAAGACNPHGLARGPGKLLDNA